MTRNITITVERTGWLGWSAEVDWGDGTGSTGAAFTRRGACRMALRWLRNESRRIETRETFKL